ncbi:MAG: CarD family transcriptional regulator, partial [Oscillospiraceae bacterium]
CDRYYADKEYLFKKAEKSRTVIFEEFARTLPPEISTRGMVNFKAMTQAPWGGELDLLLEEIRPAIHMGESVAVLLPTERGCRALERDLQSEGIDAKYEAKPILHPSTVKITDLSVSGGFYYPTAKITVFSHRRTALPPKKLRKRKVGEAVWALSDLSSGDYVVHAVHGIGVFCGIVKREVLGVTKDYIKIRYQGSDMLFVPVTQLDLVSKYIGKSEDGNLKLSKLGSPEWQKTRTRVRAAVADMAAELMVLYKKRLNAVGHAFAEDNDWQRDFELRFPYEETDDQLRCIEEIKEDMQMPKPMDRLLCGDVGFGKTEVAIRAAFKCVLDSMQCAVLVPTTILAWQHYNTFTQRMEGFPVKVELLSRFRTPKQQAEVIKGLKDGTVDIVIGTHRLISSDVSFKNLGLCVIDEEQRFGVAHKEKFKQL